MKPALIQAISLCTAFSLCFPAYALQPPGALTAVDKNDWEEVNFEFNSAVLTDGFPSLLRLAELLSKNVAFRVRLDGHADQIGSDRYNEKLGQKRSEAVKAFLEKYGAKPAQVEVVSRGKREPKVTGGSAEARFINRRVKVTVLDGQGNVVSTGGIGDAIQAVQDRCPDYSATLTAILKKLDKLDDIQRAIDGLRGENQKLRAEVDGLKGQQAQAQAATQALAQQAPTAADIDKTTRAAIDEALTRGRDPRFSILGANAGLDQDGNLTFQGRARYFAPFREKFAVQAQGEYLYFKERQEGQFDLGLVSRFNRRGQVGLFSSFKRIGVDGAQNGATLGQGAFTLDYIFGRGRVGFYGTKAFMDGTVINRTAISRNIFLEQYARVADQAGASTALTLLGRTMLEANAGWMAVRGGGDKPGGTVRLIQPLNSRLALTLEGGWNETLITPANSGRVVGGLMFGNFAQPKDYLASDAPVPVDVPRVRYELLTRRVRTGNDAPVADAGGDKLNVPAGVIELDGSASYDPDGDALTFQWDQVAGPSVALSGRNTARASFTAEEGKTYSFRLTVRDTAGLTSLARATVTTLAAPKVTVQRFTATPASIKAGASSVLAWQVQNADEVSISGIGTVNPQAGTVTVSPTATTIYRLTAKNRTGEAVETVQVTVEEPVTPQIRIVSFRANPSAILPGASSNLVWETENAETVTIEGIGNVQPTGTATVSPAATTTYILRAANRAGSVSATATVTVNAPGAPRILTFASSALEVLEGEAATLSWSVEGAAEVTITGLGAVAQQGSAPVSPAGTQTYTLTARNAGGQSTASVTIAVVPRARIVSFTASPSTSPAPGAKVRLTWQTTGADSVSLSGVGPVAASGSLEVAPATSATYTLTATGRRNTETASLTVAVTGVDGNRAPVIQLNVPEFLTTKQRELFFDASASTDPDGDALSYEWRAFGVHSQYVTIDSPRSPRTRIVLRDFFADYAVELKVTDSKGVSSTRQVRIFVDPRP